MKKIAEFICSDQPGHIIMTGGSIKKYFDPAVKMTAQERNEYVKGLMTVYPYMFLSNYYRWLYEGEKAPKDYQEFMKADQPGVVVQAVPILDAWYDEKSKVPYEDRVKNKIGLIMDIPFLILGNFHRWLYAGTKDAKDYQDFIKQTKPSLTSVLGGIVLKAYYDKSKPLSAAEKTQVMLFIGTEYGHILIRKYYTWLFGEEKIVMPGPPPAK